MDGQMRRHDARQGLIGGAILVALGAHFLFRQVFDFDLGRYGWPLFIIGPGLLLFAGMVVSGRGAGSMAIPASIVTTIGLLLFVQNATNYYESWAYAWALIPLAAGLGTCIAGAWDGNATLVAEGQPVLAHLWDKAARFAIPALLGWTAFSLVKAFAAALESRAGYDHDDQATRSRRTRIAILSRSAAFVIVFVTVALMLLGVPGVRNIGVTLMASAGLAGLAVGAAAQPALKSLIAGIQMALTEPIRIDDLVVIDGESGRVEEIRLTYVVIRTADERRLIVPTVKFLDTSFQNWTRVSGGITGWVGLPVKPGTPLAPIRAAFEGFVTAEAGWDGRKREMQVHEARVGSIELRLLVSAKDPAALVRLRLGLREKMLEWLREAMPEALCVGG